MNAGILVECLMHRDLEQVKILRPWERHVSYISSLNPIVKLLKKKEEESVPWRSLRSVWTIDQR